MKGSKKNKQKGGKRNKSLKNKNKRSSQKKGGRRWDQNKLDDKGMITQSGGGWPFRDTEDNFSLF